MRVLLDECIPHPLRRHLPGHIAATVAYMGWLGKRNGELLAAMIAEGFDVLLTVDRGLPDQQNITAAGIAVVILVAGSNKPADLLPLMPKVLTALNSIQPGDVVEITP